MDLTKNSVIFILIVMKILDTDWKFLLNNTLNNTILWLWKRKQREKQLRESQLRKNQREDSPKFRHWLGYSFLFLLPESWFDYPKYLFIIQT